MKKCIYKDYRNEETITGFIEEIKWKPTSYYGGPKRNGKFITADGEGNIERVYCTGDTTGAKLFDAIVNHYYGAVKFFDGENKTELTDSDLVKLYSEYHVWYTIDEYWTDCGNECFLTILRGAAIPKYFLDTELHGPIDSEIVEYDAISVDVYGEPL